MTAEKYPSKQAVLHVTALIVSLCSFAYELVYSELLTIMYGGTVTQYGLTIGLFFSSLGLGSYLSQHLDENRPGNFFRTQIYLACVAPVGFLFIFWLNAANPLGAVPGLVTQIAARLPVVLVGILSGFELPLLLSMVNAESRTDTTKPRWLNATVARFDSLCQTVMGLFFQTTTDDTTYSNYSTVLAMDYLGGLVGALVYVFVLYPEIGLIPSVFVLALLNCVAALAFTARFSERPWGLVSGEDRVIFTSERTSVFLTCLVLTTLWGGVALNHGTVNQELTEYYLESVIEDEYPEDNIDAAITDLDTTQHQQIVEYNRTWEGSSSNQLFAGSSERCLRLDTAVQLCNSWAESYHNGLVDVPMTMYENSTATDVLLVGGGDWIAANHLRDHNVSVDQVDLDGEFMEQSKSSEYLAQYHEGAYTYEHLNSYEQDAYAYLQHTDTQYDLILLDLPGAKSEGSLSLYTTEFYTLLNAHLSETGTLVSWAYDEHTYSEHNKVYLNTVEAAGFEYQLPYWAYGDFNRDGQTQLGERFYMFAPDANRPTVSPTAGTTYVKQYAQRYRQLSWRHTPTYEGIETNSVFHPNYEILIQP